MYKKKKPRHRKRLWSNKPTRPTTLSGEAYQDKRNGKVGPKHQIWSWARMGLGAKTNWLTVRQPYC